MGVVVLLSVRISSLIYSGSFVCLWLFCTLWEWKAGSQACNVYNVKALQKGHSNSAGIYNITYHQKYHSASTPESSEVVSLLLFPWCPGSSQSSLWSWLNVVDEFAASVSLVFSLCGSVYERLWYRWVICDDHLFGTFNEKEREGGGALDLLGLWY